MKYVDFNLQNKIYKINQANNIKKIRHCLFLIMQIIHSLFVKNIPRNIYIVLLMWKLITIQYFISYNNIWKGICLKAHQQISKKRCFEN